LQLWDLPPGIRLLRVITSGYVATPKRLKLQHAGLVIEMIGLVVLLSHINSVVSKFDSILPGRSSLNLTYMLPGYLRSNTTSIKNAKMTCEGETVGDGIPHESTRQFEGKVFSIATGLLDNCESIVATDFNF
jgi:hypothetical protein